jgi:hypothetical protein
MAQAYRFAIVRLAPDEVRGERLNIALAVFTERGLDVRLGKSLDKVRAISAAVDRSTLRELLDGLAGHDERLRSAGIAADSDRAHAMERIGPLRISRLGTFSTEGSADYEMRVASILRTLVDAEPAPPRAKRKSSRLLTQLKAEFRREHVLAKRDEDIGSHRIVAGYEIDEGLVADLVLKNGAMHVVETVDASDEDASTRRAVTDIAVSALVLERARMQFGKKTQSRLVYRASPAIEDLARPSLEAAEHQGAILTNWASADDRGKFVNLLSSLATPLEKGRRQKTVHFRGARLI